MKGLETNTIYLIGIGGIGMSALARYFKQMGKEVSGYDRMPTPLSRELEKEGINIHYKDDPAYIPCDAGMVIYTPAIPKSNMELAYCRELKFNIRKRAEVLGMIADGFDTIAIAGTHGKTSISSMTAHIFRYSDHAITALIGGIMNNYETNMLRAGKSMFLIAEADEYDRSFLNLHPKITVVSTLAADHLDIYGSLENMKESFSQFIGQTKPDGTVILHESIKDQIRTPLNTIVYGSGADADIKITNVEISDHQYCFDLNSGGKGINIRMLVPGMHNIENATAAASVCLQAGLKMDEIKAGLESYTGVKRRFEYILQGDVIFIDDYAHHPDEIAACIDTARKLYPDNKLTGVFQPHLYTRTRDFADGFAAALGALDEVILLDIYPAREEAIEGVDSAMLLKKIHHGNKQLCNMDDLPMLLSKNKPEVLLTMGAGNIDQIIIPIREMLTK